MTFREATDRLKRADVDLTAVAAAFGVSPNTVSRWRRADSPSSSRNAFNPPDGWPATLQKLAKQRIRAQQTNENRLKELITALEAE